MLAITSSIGCWLNVTKPILGRSESRNTIIMLIMLLTRNPTALTGGCAAAGV